MATAPPEAGDLVEVRRRQFVVTDVERTEQAVNPLETIHLGAWHLVSLSSVEEDALAEELQVVWELEPGARVHDRVLLPEPRGFDPPRRFDAFLNAMRWGAIQSADSSALQAPFRAGIAIEDYQLDPVVRALAMPRVSLLIADDVGLGKTIEAGLVAQELLLRHRADTILVACPASLCIKWRDEMQEKFGLEFRIVDAEALRDLRRRRGAGVNPWTHHPRLITSIDYLKRDRPLQLFRQCLPAPGEAAWPRRFDLLIVDEAHNVAPSGSGRYAMDSQRTLAIRTIRPHFEHALFLSATPHNGYRESFTSLLELLDDQRFAREVEPDRRQLEAVMVHRLKSEIVDEHGRRVFPDRKLEALEVRWSDAEKEVHAKLQEYTQCRAAAAGDDAGTVGTEFVLKMLKKRLFSSPAAFAATIEKHVRTLRGIRDEEPVERRRPAAGILQRELERLQEDVESDEDYEAACDDAVTAATDVFATLSAREKELLRELGDWAHRASAQGDAKVRRLLAWLNETLRPSGTWNDERVIIFTEYRATQRWLQEQLARNGLAAAGRLEVIYGGMDEDERERIKAAFQANPADTPVRILLATDTASEGIDLQNWCHRLIHYEIPWNPTRLEQRNGRIDRHGQKADEVLVHHFVGEGWDARRPPEATAPGDLNGDLEFLMRAAVKVDAIRQDLGKVGPVIAAQVEQAMLGRRTTLDTRQAERDAEPVRRMLTFERELRERIARLHEQLEESRRELCVTPESVRAVVETGLALAGQPPLREATLDGVWPDPTGRRAACPVFWMPSLVGSWAACAVGLLDPVKQVTRPITFDHDLAASRRDKDVVLVHLEHPLVRRCQRLLRAEAWASSDRAILHRVTIRQAPAGALASPVAVMHGRLLVTGGSHQRLHEEVIDAGLSLEHGRTRRLNVGETREALAAGGADEPATAEVQKLQRIWPDLRERLRVAFETRARERTRNLGSILQRRAEKEAGDMRELLEELARTIRAELAVPDSLQMRFAGMEDAERLQRERNREALVARLARIPDEIIREQEQVHRRYAAPREHVFPVAVSVILPHGARLPDVVGRQGG